MGVLPKSTGHYSRLYLSLSISEQELMEYYLYIIRLAPYSFIQRQKTT